MYESEMMNGNKLMTRSFFGHPVAARRSPTPTRAFRFRDEACMKDAHDMLQTRSSDGLWLSNAFYLVYKQSSAVSTVVSTNS